MDGVAFLVVAAGFVLRMLPATKSYLNPDELLHYLLIHQRSAYLAYKASLSNAHPPLFYQAIYAAHFLGNSELMLRLPSVIAGTAFCWFMYKWIGTILGNAAALIGVIVVAFCPGMIPLAAEVREYALLLFCVAASLYFLERAFQENSVALIWAFSAFLYLAILTHYSAVFFALTVGVYSLARFADSRPPRNVLIAWAAGQAGALAIYAFLYVTHVSKLKNYIASWAMPFEQSYFRLDRESIFAFTQKKYLEYFSLSFPAAGNCPGDARILHHGSGDPFCQGFDFPPGQAIFATSGPSSRISVPGGVGCFHCRSVSLCWNPAYGAACALRDRRGQFFSRALHGKNCGPECWWRFS